VDKGPAPNLRTNQVDGRPSREPAFFLPFCAFCGTKTGEAAKIPKPATLGHPNVKKQFFGRSTPARAYPYLFKAKCSQTASMTLAECWDSMGEKVAGGNISLDSLDYPPMNAQLFGDLAPAYAI
jgi:hypothetical protein